MRRYKKEFHALRCVGNNDLTSGIRNETYMMPMKYNYAPFRLLGILVAATSLISLSQRIFDIGLQPIFSILSITTDNFPVSCLGGFPSL